MIRFTKQVLFFCFLLISVTIDSYSQTKYSNEFLSIGVGARALGMSNTHIATVNDVTSGYWNPSGLTQLKSNLQVALMHSEYFAGIAKYDYAGVAKKIDTSSVVAVSVIRFGVDGIPNTTELIDANGNWDYNRISTFSATDYAFVFSYARKMDLFGLKGLRIGGNAKVIRRIIGNFAGAWGFGLDAGAQYDYKKWKFALMARDVTSTFNAWSYNLSDNIKNTLTATGNAIPSNSIEITIPRLITGIARKNNFYYDKIALITEFDLDATFDGKRNTILKTNIVSIDPHVGFEIGYLNFVFLRGGIGNIQSTTDIDKSNITTFQPNFGVGVKVNVFTLDYAFTDIGDQSVALYSNVFSLKVDLNKSLKQ